MCTEPVEIDGQMVACRHCDQCLETRLRGWVHRAMAEKAGRGHMLALSLSYRNNPDGTKPDGARVFNYGHVQKFLKRVRVAYQRRYGATGEISYIVCGERGSRGSKRLHWHMLLFSARPLVSLGEWFNEEAREFVDCAPLETRCTWSLWPHGNMFVQSPDARGVYYVMKYAMADQFTAEKSLGKGRQNQARAWAASYFRMSKQPPIGWLWLNQWLDRHEAKGVVPPSLEVQVPDLAGYWYPAGALRVFALDRLRSMIEGIEARSGRKPAGYDSLVASLTVSGEKETQRDLEVLYYGKEVEGQEGPDERADATAWRYFVDRIEARKRIDNARRIISNCGHVTPCKECRLHWSPDQRRQLEEEERKRFDQWFDRQADKHPGAETADLEKIYDFARFRRWWLTRFRPSRGCRRKFEDAHWYAFKYGKAIRSLNRRITGPVYERNGRNSPGKRRFAPGQFWGQKMQGPPRS